MSEVKMIDIIAGEIATERWHQNEKWGEQNHPDGTRLSLIDAQIAAIHKVTCRVRADNGSLTWRDILQEEVSEAFAEWDTDLLEAELIRVAAVCVAWIEAIRRRSGKIAARTTQAMMP